MKKLPSIIACALMLLATSAFAKDIAVLLPVAGPLTPYEKTELSRVVVEGLAAKFDMQYGEDVQRIVEKVFQEESKKNNCDESNCYRRIGTHYHADKIVALRVTEVEKGHFLLTSNLYDVPTGSITSSQKEECTQCSFEKLKVICNELIGRIGKAQ
jgi:ribosomal protein L37AE/L43A